MWTFDALHSGLFKHDEDLPIWLWFSSTSQVTMMPNVQLSCDGGWIPTTLIALPLCSHGVLPRQLFVEIPRWSMSRQPRCDRAGPHDRTCAQWWSMLRSKLFFSACKHLCLCVSQSLASSNLRRLQGIFFCGDGNFLRGFGDINVVMRLPDILTLFAER